MHGVDDWHLREVLHETEAGLGKITFHLAQRGGVLVGLPSAHRDAQLALYGSDGGRAEVGDHDVMFGDAAQFRDRPLPDLGVWEVMEESEADDGVERAVLVGELLDVLLLDRALQSARSDLAIISQATIQPFRMPTKVGARGSPINDGTAKFHHLHLYRLPWPVEELETLGEKRVELKVTLSYFIEPSPGQFAPKTPALYRSHGLRFDLQGRLENEAVFLSRINGLAAADEADEITSEDAVDDNDDEAISVGNEPNDRWRFGSNSRNYKAAGSLHCDVWQGPGVDLAARRTLAVYPVSGWWKTRALKKRYNSKAHYTLIMTLRSLEQDVDLHTPVDVAIKTWIDQDVDI